MHEGNGFRQKLLEKARPAMVRPASSDKWKAPYVYVYPTFGSVLLPIFYIKPFLKDIVVQNPLMTFQYLWYYKRHLITLKTFLER